MRYDQRVATKLAGNEELRFAARIPAAFLRLFAVRREGRVGQSTEEICSSAVEGPFGIQLSEGNPADSSPPPSPSPPVDISHHPLLRRTPLSLRDPEGKALSIPQVM